MLAALLLSTQTPKTAAPAVPAPAELRLRVARPSIAPDQDPGYSLVIRNTGRKALRLITPQDGSDMGWRNPEVKWILPDLKQPRGYARCGNTNSIEEDAFFTLRPGESREITTCWSGPVELRPGVNRVSFRYDIRRARKDNGFSGIVFADGMPPEMKARQDRITGLYSQLTPIRLTSNVVRVTVRANP